MLRIERSANGVTHLSVSGEVNLANMADLASMIEAEPSGRRIVLDLRDLTLVDRDAIQYLADCESGGIRLKNCPGYVREWIRRERNSK